MQEYYFLFLLAFVWIIFAVFQDTRTREISNWLNFSLIAFVLAYRAFYSIYSRDARFFLFGLGGVLLFVIFGYAFYYGKLFAGGDAKLLMGLGGIFPYQNLSDYVYLGLGFVFLLFFVGAIYTLIYSTVLVSANRKKFIKEFKKIFSKFKKLLLLDFVLLVILIFTLFASEFDLFLFAFLVLAVTPLIYVYSKAVEQACMIKLVYPNKLTEGDWLEKDVRIGKKLIRKSVHGLSKEEIKLLKKARKKVLIKEGIPFSPAFLIALLIFVLYYVGNI